MRHTSAPIWRLCKTHRLWVIGQNPQAQQIMASLQAHIAEHLGFKYRKDIEEKLGAPLPAPNEELPEDMEVQLARVVAEAGKQLTQAITATGRTETSTTTAARSYHSDEAS